MSEKKLERGTIMIRVLVTNDDGINATGIRELVKSLSLHADVYVFAPDEQKSAMSHALSMRKELTARERKVQGAVYAAEVSGTPADSVKYGLAYMKKKNLSVDFIFSGINLGGNTGSDIVYSGTCAGAREGALNNIHSIAVSVANHEAREFDYIYSILKELMEVSKGLPASTFLNVNQPDLPVWKIKGIKLVPAAPHSFGKQYSLVPAEDGKYRYSIDHLDHDVNAQNDYAVIGHDYVTVTPIMTSVTDEISLMKLKKMSYDNTVCVLVDLQEKLVPAMRKPKKLVENARKLLRSMDRMDVPVIVTEQYSKGLGKTVQPLADAVNNATYVDKTSFDAFGEKSFEEVMDKVTGEHVVLLGAESHICVLLTARSLIERGYTVHVAYDCCASRTKELHEKAMRELEAMGAKVSSWETIVYDMMENSHHPAFKTISSIVKE